MAKPEKVATVAAIAEQFKGSSAAVITEYRGLSVAKMTQLRAALGTGSTYAVAKNTLVKRAAADAGVFGLDELFVGPTAIVFITGEPVEAAKALKTFAKDNKALVIKGGIMDGRTLTVDEIDRIADLESREVLLAKLAGAMKGNLSKAAGLFNAPISKAAQLLLALQEKKASEPGAVALEVPAVVTEDAVVVTEDAAAPAEDAEAAEASAEEAAASADAPEAPEAPAES